MDNVIFNILNSLHSLLTQNQVYLAQLLNSDHILKDSAARLECSLKTQRFNKSSMTAWRPLQEA
jgi:DNA-binding CsgD family transcriptional regulator